MEAAKPRKLERETCSRCGGSGNYSYCSMYGTRCFKCHGNKVVLTKRGAAAMAFLKNLRSKRADELKVGDRVRHDGLVVPGAVNDRAGWAVVEMIEPHDSTRHGRAGDPSGPDLWEGTLEITTSRCSHGGVSVDRMFEVLHTKEENEAFLTAALEYEATLNKNGTPKKIKK